MSKLFEAAGNERISWGGYVFDNDRSTLRVPELGIQLRLIKSQKAVVRELILAQGNPVGQELRSRLGQEDNDSLIRMSILRVRGKLGSHGDLIATEHSFGYRLVRVKDEPLKIWIGGKELMEEEIPTEYPLRKKVSAFGYYYDPTQTEQFRIEGTGDAIHLTPRESQLAMELIEAQGEDVSTQYLGESLVLSQGGVRTYVARIRGKLKDPGCIVSGRRGYSLRRLG